MRKPQLKADGTGHSWKNCSTNCSRARSLSWRRSIASLGRWRIWCKSLTKYKAEAPGSGRSLNPLIQLGLRAIARCRCWECWPPSIGLNWSNEPAKVNGPPAKLSPAQQREILDMLAAGRSAADLARLFRVHRATISRLVAKAQRPDVSEAAKVPWSFSELAKIAATVSLGLHRAWQAPAERVHREL